MVCGETSGDILGAGLIQAIRKKYPDSHFLGIPGPQMIAAGCEELYPMERLAVMGFGPEVLRRIPELLGIRKRLAQQFIQDPPDVFIGIDAPDFTLSLERSLFEARIPTVHYVSPSVWAWRQYRVKKIVRSMNLMLTLFPFEPDFYKQFGLEAKFVGHPLADQMPLEPDKATLRAKFGMAEGEPWVALLPGSRSNEVKRLAPVMLQTARYLVQKRQDFRFVIPCANARAREQIEAAIVAEGQGLAIKLLDGQSREVMTAADCILLASGTATLEGLLAKTPMVVTYKLSPFSYWLMKKLAKVKHVSLANLLAEEPQIPELLQDDAQPAKLGEAVLYWFLDKNRTKKSIETFYQIHTQLRQGASERAAAAVLELIGK